MPRILLLNDTSQIENWGCQATAFALDKMLKASIPGLEISTWSQDKLTQEYKEIKLPLLATKYFRIRTLRSQSVSLLGAAFKQDTTSDRLFPRNANYYALTRDHWLGLTKHPFVADALNAIQNVDMVIHNAELLNFSYNIVSSRGAFLVWLAKTHLGKLSGMINQTTPAPEGDPVMSGILRLVCPELDLVTVREVRSFSAMKMWGLDCSLVPDPAFSIREQEFDPHSSKTWRSQNDLEGRPYFCLSLSSGLPVAGGRSSLTNLVMRLQKIIPNAVLLAYGGGAWLLRSLAATIPNCHVYEGNFLSVKPLLEDAEFLVSGHYHNLIFSALAGCPFIPLTGISHKIQGLLELLEWPYRKCFNPTAIELEIDPILRRTVEIVQDGTNLREHLIHRSEHLRDEALNTGRYIREILETNAVSGNHSPSNLPVL